MEIVADANIPFVKQAFAALGKVRTMPARALTQAIVKDADLVLTRSTVKLGPSLLEGSRARFVATATSGVDHVDQAWLKDHNIGFSSAHGSNARSVAEWWVAGLFTLQHQGKLPDIRTLSLGIVGVGAVGKHILKLAQALAFANIQLCDPPRARQHDTEDNFDFVSLDPLLRTSDVVTFHVPLHKQGPDKTLHLIDDTTIKNILPHALLCNASRGQVVSGEALMSKPNTMKTLFDVWEHEPAVYAEHVASVDVGTPHIAGHSLDAKIHGTAQIYQAACRWLNITPTWQLSDVMPPKPAVVVLDAHNKTLQEVLHQAVRASYVITNDDQTLRELVRVPIDGRGLAFRGFRNQYPIHREFAATRLALKGATPEAENTLRAMDFDLV